MGDNDTSVKDLFGSGSAPAGGTGEPGAASSTPQTTPGDGSATTPATTTPPAAQPGMTPESVRELVRSVATEFKPKEPQKEMTPEEFDRAFAVAKVSPQHVERILKGGEDAVGALNEIVQAAARQSVTMAQHLLRNHQSEYDQKLQPYMQFATTVRENMYRQEFFEQNKDLVGYEEVMQDVQSRLDREGLKGTKEEVFKRLAEETRKVIKSVAAKATPAGDGNTQTTPPNKMTSLSSGGQGGAGSAGGGKSSSTAKTIFG